MTTYRSDQLIRWTRGAQIVSGRVLAWWGPTDGAYRIIAEVDPAYRRPGGATTARLRSPSPLAPPHQIQESP